MKISSINKARLLNYEYLMLQSFVDPFFAETVVYINKSKQFKLFNLESEWIIIIIVSVRAFPDGATPPKVPFAVQGQVTWSQ